MSHSFVIVLLSSVFPGEQLLLSVEGGRVDVDDNVASSEFLLFCINKWIEGDLGQVSLREALVHVFQQEHQSRLLIFNSEVFRDLSQADNIQPCEGIELDFLDTVWVLSSYFLESETPMRTVYDDWAMGLSVVAYRDKEVVFGCDVLHYHNTVDEVALICRIWEY